MNLIKPAPAFDLLRVLIAVAESRNFREAASKLNMSQPGVSVKLRELEALQPLPIFSVEGKRKVLTHFGRALCEAATEGTRHIDLKIENLHREYSIEKNLTLRIGGRNEVLEYVAPYLEFDGKLELKNYSGNETVSKLLEHEIDIAISYIVPNSTDLHAKKLFRSGAHFAIHEKFLKNRRLSRELLMNREFLLNTPCVSYLRDGHLIRDWAKHAGVAFADFEVKYVTENWGTVQRLIEQGVGFGILPFYVQNYSNQIRRIELAESVIRPLDFFAIFDSNLKKIAAFKKILCFKRFAPAMRRG